MTPMMVATSTATQMLSEVRKPGFAYSSGSTTAQRSSLKPTNKKSRL